MLSMEGHMIMTDGLERRIWINETHAHMDRFPIVRISAEDIRDEISRTTSPHTSIFHYDSRGKGSGIESGVAGGVM